MGRLVLGMVIDEKCVTRRYLITSLSSTSKEQERPKSEILTALLGQWRRARCDETRRCWLIMVDPRLNPATTTSTNYKWVYWGNVCTYILYIHHTSWYNQCIPVSKATKSNAGLALIIWTLALPCWTLLGAFWIENTSPASDVPKYVRWMRPEHPTLSNVQQVPSVNMASHNAPMTPNDLMIFLCSATWKSTDN